MTALALSHNLASRIRAAILDQVLPWHGCSVESLDEVTREQARTITLELLAETRRVIEAAEAYADELAHVAALAGATHEERGAAVGLKKEAARRRWPWPAAR